jgi:hypothetical protein
MGFFDDLRLPGVDPEDEEDYRAPEWCEAPEDMVAGVVPFELLLARSREAAVYLTRVAAYPAGFEFDVELVTRKPGAVHDAFDLIHRDWGTPGEPLPPELVRIGIEYADGRRTTSFGEMIDGTSSTLTAADPSEQPDPASDIRMTAGGGGGSPRHTTRSYWVWPLPPEGLLRFVVEWPVYDIGETSVEIDSSSIRDASQRAVSVWDD